MTTLGWVGVGLIAFGALWAFMMWLSAAWFGRSALPADEMAQAENPIAAIIKAIADMFRAAADLLKLSYGAPALVMLLGLVLVVIDSV